MKLFLKLFIALIFIILLLIVYIEFAWQKDYSHVAYPNIVASTDAEVIARGEYLVYGPAHCGSCHVPVDRLTDVEDGMKVPLKGGWEVDIPPAVMRAPNITPDKETGIGKLTDGEIARALRYGIRHDGRYMLPIMPYHEMSDEDLRAVISYLRAQEPVYNEIELTTYSFMGKALQAFGILKPGNLDVNPPQSVSPEDTLAYGKYLSVALTNCFGCHTEIDLRTGNYIGADFAGGFLFDSEPFSDGYSFVSPNLTPDMQTGVMAHWTEEVFVDRFKRGRIHRGSPMPWGPLSRMDTFELKAIYQYLKSLEPVNNPIVRTVFPPGEPISQSE